ncbi:hypothetical protein N8T08_009890 [Aspergillus melleus]|uniref:Uncharacterized protein n=1 Tax=Aspergillus melleus TaxID=138277 RepID=A0ACC3ASX3_9EURO|nr:hypothetical protein N8T08_009890 [Aspergillus melleus]
MTSPDATDGGYGWVIVFAVFWNNAHVWGILSSYGVFLEYFTSHSIFPHSRALDFALIGGLSTSQALVISPLITAIHRRFGLRATIALGVLFETAALLGASWSTAIWQLYLSQGVCFGWGLGLQYLSTTAIIPQWFNKRRSLAAAHAMLDNAIGPLAAEVVGLEELQSCLTIAWLVCSVPATFGAAIGLELRTTGEHEYLHTQLFTGFMYIAASLCTLLLRGWKISDKDRRGDMLHSTVKMGKV